MAETGINDILWKRYVDPEPNCKPIRAKGTPLGMEKFSSLFVLYAVSCFLSLNILVLENIFKPPKLNESIDEFSIIKIENIQREMKSLTDHDALPLHLQKEVKRLMEEFQMLIPKK